MTKAINSHPHVLPTVRTRNQAAAVSETARAAAGRARWLYEMATGESGDANEPPALPKNPQGLYGADFSGPPYGVAKRHAMAHSGEPIAFAASTYFVDTPTIVANSGISKGAHARIWVKPHTTQQGPYRRLTISLAANYITIANTLTVSVRNAAREDRLVETTVAINSSVLTLYDAVVDVPVVAGWNRLEIGMRPDSTSGVRIRGWALNQVVQTRDT